MYIGMRGHDFEANSMEELVSKCNKYNVHHIQLALAKTIEGFKKGDFSEEYAKEIGKTLKDGNVHVTVLGCYINPSDTHPDSLKDSLEFFVENLKYAKYIGADCVGLETGFVGDKLSIEKNNTEEAYQHLLKNMRYLVGEAEKLGVKIGIEGVSSFVINTPQRMARLVDDLNSENVCTIFDPVNYLNEKNFENQNEIIDEYFRLLGEKTVVLHLKDFKNNDGRICYAYPTTGLLNTKLVLDKIKEVNPDMPVMLEEVKEPMINTVWKNVQDMQK